MKHLIAPVRPVGRAFATISATALSVLLASAAAVAQQPAPPAQPPAQRQQPARPAQPPAKPAPQAQQRPGQPAQPAQPVQPPQGQAQAAQPDMQLIYSPWTKFCLKGQEANAKQVCFTGKDARIESGMPVVAAVLIEPEGDPKKVLRVTVPLGVQLQHGTRIIVDQTQPLTGPYVICFTNGCMADYEANADMVNRLKKGQNMTVQAINANGQPMSLALPLSGEFAKAYDGPPTDPKVFEEQQRKLQEELQRRADEARKRLESQGQQPPKPQ
jgi:invasion protein IalB